MPLTNCPHCDHEVSPDADTCPECGAPLREGTGTRPLLKNRGHADLALFIMLGLVVVGLVWCG